MTQQKFKLPEQVFFILFGDALNNINRGGSIALTPSYNDHANALGKGKGTFVEYVTGKDARGNPKGKRYKFDGTFRRIMTRPSDIDINGLSQYDFLKNAPECEGSPNGKYSKSGVQIGVVYREYNPEKDAQTALEADTLRVTAQATALALDVTVLEEIANILGHYGEPDNAMRVRVIDFAGKRPSEFNELLASGDRSLRALVRKALEEGIFKKKGSLIFWEESLMGNDEDQVIAKLNTEQATIDALKEKMSFNVNAKAKNAPNLGGRPRKDKPVEKTL